MCRRWFFLSRDLLPFIQSKKGQVRFSDVGCIWTGKEVAFSLPQIVIDDISKQNASANGHLLLISKAFLSMKFDTFQNIGVDQIFSSMNTRFLFCQTLFKSPIKSFINYFKELIMKLFSPTPHHHFQFLNRRENK